MKNKISISLVLFVLVLLMIPSCGIVRLLDRTPENITDQLTRESRLISKELTIGIFEGIGSDNASEGTNKLISQIIDSLNVRFQELNFENLKVEAVGQKLILSLSEELEMQSANIGMALDNALDNVSLNGLFENLNSIENQDNLSALLGSIFSAESGNGKQLGLMLNRAISEIDMTPISNEINQNLRINLDSILNEQLIVDKILDTTTNITDVVSEGQNSFRSNLTAVVVAIIILYILHFLLNKTNDKYFKKINTINEIFMQTVDEMDTNTPEYKNLKEKIYTLSKRKKVESNLENYLAQFRQNNT